MNLCYMFEMPCIWQKRRSISVARAEFTDQPPNPFGQAALRRRCQSRSCGVIDGGCADAVVIVGAAVLVKPGNNRRHWHLKRPAVVPRFIRASVVELSPTITMKVTPNTIIDSVPNDTAKSWGRCRS